MSKPVIGFIGVGFMGAGMAKNLVTKGYSLVIMGMGTALKQAITIEGGVIQQTNFNTYAMVRTNESPLVDIILVKSAEKPGGIGEPVTATIVPALANAVAKLTGKRVRNLPITGKAIQEA